MFNNSGKMKQYIIEQIYNYIVIVGPKGKFYLMPIGSGVPMKCSCPGFTYNGKCKHITFVMEMDLKETDIIAPEKIGPWTGELSKYADNYKLSPDKPTFYIENRIPLP